MFRKVRIGLAVLGVAASAGALHSASATSAQYDDYAYVKVYYTDGSRQQVAGRETLYCDGRSESFGLETPYFRYYNGVCP